MPGFNLRRHYPTEIEFWSTEEGYSEPCEVKAQLTLGVGPNTSNPLDWRVNSKVTFTAKAGKKTVARGSVAFVGFFDVPMEMEEAKRQKFVAENGASILYAATRELVANITARAPNKLITLPPTSFGGLNPDIKVAPTLVTAAKA